MWWSVLLLLNTLPLKGWSEKLRLRASYPSDGREPNVCKPQWLNLRHPCLKKWRTNVDCNFYAWPANDQTSSIINFMANKQVNETAESIGNFTHFSLENKSFQAKKTWCRRIPLFALQHIWAKTFDSKVFVNVKWHQV